MRNSTKTISMKLLRRSGLQTKNRIKSYEKIYRCPEKGMPDNKITRYFSRAQKVVWTVQICELCWTLPQQGKITRIPNILRHRRMSRCPRHSSRASGTAVPGGRGIRCVGQPQSQARVGRVGYERGPYGLFS